MQVVLTSHGSTGDIFPMIAFGRALKNSGHDVRFATSPPFQRDIEAAGLPYVELPPRWSMRELAYWMGRLQLYSNPLFQLRELYRAALPHISDLIDAMDRVLAEADLLVSSYLFPMNLAIAERRGVPFATFAFAHNTVPSRYYPPEGVPRLRYVPRRLQHIWNRWSWRLGNLAVDTIINQTIARQLRARGLPLVKDFFSKPADLVLVVVSECLMKPPFRLHRRFVFTGYCRWQIAEDPAADRELELFCRGRQVPVISFGRMVYDGPAAWIERLARHWPRDRRLVIQRGWAGFEAPADRPHIKVVASMSHDQLFRHAAVVVHHGGAGTTASVLHAGLPHVIVPHIADQHFFAPEIKRLGCGVKLDRKHWPEQLAQQVEAVESDRRYLAAARRARESLRREDGPQTAVESVERFIGRCGARGNPRLGADRRIASTRISWSKKV